MKLFLITQLCCVFSIAFAQTNDFVEKDFVGSSIQTELQAAKKDILEQAVTAVSEELIIDLIGQEAFLKNRHLLPNKIFRKSASYLPYTKNLEPELLVPGPGYRMSVHFKISVSSLKTLLQSQGLLNETELQPVVLPFIHWQDRVGLRTYKWWESVGAYQILEVDLARKVSLFENSLRKGFSKNNFFVITPTQSEWGRLIPTAFLGERLASEDVQFFGMYFHAPIIIKGAVNMLRSLESQNQYKLEIKLTAIQASNGKTLADVTRKFDTEMGSFDVVMEKKIREVVDVLASDLSAQVFEAWQKGRIGTNVLKISIRGDFTIPARESIRDRIKTYIPQIKNLRERVISKGSVTFEAESSSPAKDIVAKVTSLDFQGKKMQLISESENEIAFRF